MTKNINISTSIKEMMKREDVSIKDAAEYIGVSVGTFRNKLSQNRFSVNDLMILAAMCDYNLALLPGSTVDSLDKVEEKESHKSYIFDVPDETLKEKIEDYKIAKVEEMMSAMQAYIKTLSPEQLEMLFSDDDPQNAK